jgi:type I restriction enzyme S subunit
MNAHGWPRVPLGEVLFARADWIDLDPDADYRQVTVKMWGEGVTLRRTVKGSAIAATTQVRVRAGQFILSRIDARNGAFGIVPDELDGAVVSNDFPVYETNRDRLVPQFLKWMSKTPWFVDLCRRASEGSTNRVRLKEERFLSNPVPLPPLEEQSRVVTILDESAARILDHAQRVHAMELDLSKTLRAAFRNIISDAPRARMKEIAPLVRRPVEIDLAATYPELGVRSFGKGTFHKPGLPGLEVGSKRLFRIERGDLIFNIVFAWEGAVAVAKEEDSGRVGSHRFLTCVPDSTRVSPQFLRYFFLTEEGLQRLGQASPGGAGRNRTLGIDALNAIEVPIPTLEAQRWFDALQEKAAAARTGSVVAGGEMQRLIPAMLSQIF